MAKKYTTVQVTQSDIDRAIRKSSARCVVATAIARSIEGAQAVSIDAQTVRFTVEGDRRIYLTPPAAVGYVIAFDAGDPIHPFAFRLSEDYRVLARATKRTPAGEVRRQARDRLTKANRKVARRQERLELETDPDRITVAKKDLAAAEERQTAARKVKEQTDADLAGAPHWEPDTEPDPATGQQKRPAPPRAFKRGTRSYGHRQLRINQAPNTPEERTARGAVTAEYDRYQ